MPNQDLQNVLSMIEKMESDLRKVSRINPEELRDWDASAPEKYQMYLARQILEKLQDAYKTLEYMERPVVAEGQLELCENGRYSLVKRELATGYPLEYWDVECGHFIPSRIEYGQNGYYIVALGQDEPIEGLRVRIKL